VPNRTSPTADTCCRAAGRRAVLGTATRRIDQPSAGLQHPIDRLGVEPDIGDWHHALPRRHRPAQSRTDLRGIFRRANFLERIERRREVGHKLQSHVDRGERAGIVAQRLHDLAAFDICQRIGWLERDDLVEVLQRAEIVSKQRQGSATIDVTVDVVRVEPDGGIEVGNGAGEIVSEEPYLTAPAEAVGIVGRKSNRLAIVLAGASKVALAA